MRRRLYASFVNRNYPRLCGYVRKCIVRRLSLAGKLVWQEWSDGSLTCTVVDGRYVTVSRDDLDDYCHNVLAYAWSQLVRQNPKGSVSLVVLGAVRDSIGKYRSQFGSGRGSVRSVRSVPIGERDKGYQPMSRIECRELALLLPTLLSGREGRIANMLVWAYLRDDNPPSRDDIAKRLGVSVRSVSYELKMVRSAFEFLLFVSQ